MPTAYITGANGCLGLNVCEVLLDQGWDVIAAHRQHADTHFLKKLPVTTVIADIADQDALRDSMPDGVDAVLHIAGSTHLWRGNNENQNKANIDGTENVASVALEKKAKRFIYTSSIMAYGLHDNTIDENTISNAEHGPINYSRTKYLAEQLLKTYLGKGLPVIILNPCSFTGKYDTHNWSRLFTMAKAQAYIAAPPGQGMFADVRDIAHAHVAAVGHGRVGENYLLGGTQQSYRDIINRIQRRLNKTQTKLTAPRFLVKLMAVAYEAQSLLTQKPPLTSYQEAEMLCASILCRSDKAIRELSYNISPLETVLDHTQGWWSQSNAEKHRDKPPKSSDKQSD